MKTRRRTPASPVARRTSNRWLSAAVLLAVAAFATVAIRAQVGTQVAGGDEANPNFDIRTFKEDPRLADNAAATEFVARVSEPAVGAARALAVSRAAGVARLKGAFGDVTVDAHPSLGTAEIISVKPGGAFFTPASADRVAALRTFLQTHAAAYGISPNDAQSLVVVADYMNPAGNMAWVELEQRFNDIPVFQGVLRGAFTAKGELARTTGVLVAGSAAPATTTPVVDGAQAVALAAEGVHLALSGGDLSEKANEADGKVITFNRTAAADDIKAWQVYFPMADGVLRLAWATEIMSSPDAFLTLIDADTGTMLFRKNLTNYQTQLATYNVYTGESPAPAAPTSALPGANFQAPLVARQSLTLIGNEAPNTFNNLGWLTDGANTTDGNNVEAGMDVDGTNGVDAPVAGAARVFNFAYNPGPGNPGPGDAPTLAAFRNGEATSMFYWTNRYHDDTYRLGFTEAARNFQNDNFGRGGVALDRISAEGQDSSGINNANFATPADGGRGRMQMFVFTGPTPDRSSGLDQVILVHELTHGLSNRLHANGSGLAATMSGGMGEGWSDFYARALTATAAEPVNGVFNTGGWSTLSFNGSAFTDNYYYGIRRFPYAVKTALGTNGRPHNPLTFADIDPAQINLTDGAFPPSSLIGAGNAFQVHNIGEVWAMSLLEVRARFITRLGFATGNQRILQFVTDGMKLDPVTPTLVQGRDAILAAANAGGGTAADIADIWAGFATRGLGVLASAASATSGTVVESFIAPGDPVPTFTINDVSAVEGNAGTTNFAFTVSLANPSIGGHRVSYATADGTATSLGTPFTAAVATTLPAGAPATTSGPASPYPATLVVSGATGPIQSLAVRVNGLTHTFPADLDLLLVGPGGQQAMLLSDVGGGGAVAGVNLTFQDGAPAPSPAQLVSGTFAPTDLTPGDVMSAPAPAGPYGTALSAFNGTNPNGTWNLFVMDDASGDVGSLAGFTLFISLPGAATDYAASQGQLIFPPGTTTQTVNVSVNGDTTGEAHETFFVNLTSPLSAVIGDAQGAGTILNDDAGGAPLPPTTVADAYAVAYNTALSVPTPGVLANDTGTGPLTASVGANVTHGALALAADGSFTYTPTAGYIGPDSFTYRAVNAGGPGNLVTVSLTVNAPTNAQPPSGLRVSSMVGNVVTFRWDPPAIGPAATGFVLEAGLTPSTVLASLPLGAVPSFTIASPSASYFVRIHTLAGADRSAASNEIAVHVGVPVPPSAPANLLATVAGDSLTLAWTNTFGGAAPTGLVVDVSGAATGSLPIGVSDTFAVGGIPGGTYTLSLRAVNAAGVSPSSNAVTVTLPGACSGAPLPPANFLAFSTGNTLFLGWDTAATGPAPSSFVIGVTGSFVGSVPIGGRAISGAVPPGTYNVSLQAVNACGGSAFTAAQTVVVP